MSSLKTEKISMLLRERGTSELKVCIWENADLV